MLLSVLSHGKYGQRSGLEEMGGNRAHRALRNMVFRAHPDPVFPFLNRGQGHSGADLFGVDGGFILGRNDILGQTSSIQVLELPEKQAFQNDEMSLGGPCSIPSAGSGGNDGLL